ncbi:MAG TPA: ATP-binding protein [Bryobacteraceae bacterium]|nr:ATP-binding protein [Bryobacteraceae bacterium]
MDGTGTAKTLATDPKGQAREGVKLRLARLRGVTTYISELHGYLPALIAFATAIALHALFTRVLGASFAGIFFVYLAAMLIASWCGYGPGLLVVALTAFGLPYAMRPHFSLHDVSMGGVAVLALVSLLVSRTSATRRRIELILRKTNEELDLRVSRQTESLRLQLAELETLYGKVPAALCLLDRNLRFLRVNEEFAAMNGASAEKYIGHQLSEMLPAPMARALEPLFRRVLETGEPLLDYELEGLSPADAAARRSWVMGCAPVRTDREVVAGVQVVVLDISERKRAERAILQANKELRRANADLEQFAYSASHDLQEPLRMVSIFTQLLQREYAGKLDSRADEYILHAITGANRIETLLKGLRSYITISATEGLPGNLNTEAVLNRCLEDLRPAIAESGARFEIETLPEVAMQEVHLRQLFQNLISNGIKYRSQDAPFIRISATRDESQWIFAVRDNGIGIDRKYTEQIFGVFKRLHGSEEYSGTGIGLAICQKIVERYGGRIWVESTVGEGSCFFFTVSCGRD